MGSNLGLTRLYGRAAPGRRVLAQVPQDHGGNVSTIGALSLDGMRTGLSVPGAIDGDTMLFFVEEFLVPTLKRGDIVVMDNNPIHKLDEIEDAIEAVGAGVLFLPWLPTLRWQLAHTGTPWAAVGGLDAVPTALGGWQGGGQVTAVLLGHAFVVLAVLALVAVRDGGVVRLGATRSPARWASASIAPV